MTVYNSAFAGLSVQDIVDNTDLLSTQISENLSDAFIENYVFANGGSVNAPFFSYREQTSPFLADNPEIVAEFGDIPTSDPIWGEEKFAPIVKTAQGVRISREMLKYNSMEKVVLQVQALQNNMVRESVNTFRKAFDEANVPTQQASSAWDGAAPAIVQDIFTAKRSVASAAGDNGEKFGFNADTLVISSAMADVLISSEEIQKFYNANVAEANPVFSGVLPGRFAGLNIVTSSLLPDDSAYVLQSKAVGLYKDADPLTITPLYAEFGENTYGGSNQSWRIDAFRTRGIAVTAPKAAVKLTGLTGGE